MFQVSLHLMEENIFYFRTLAIQLCSFIQAWRHVRLYHHLSSQEFNDIEVDSETLSQWRPACGAREELLIKRHKLSAVMQLNCYRQQGGDIDHSGVYFCACPCTLCEREAVLHIAQPQCHLASMAERCGYFNKTFNVLTFMQF